MSGWPLLFESIASTLCNCTANETTLAIGASVPTTKEDPLWTVGVVGEEGEDPPPAEQPVATNAAAAKEASAKGKILCRVLESIKVNPLQFGVVFLTWNSQDEEQARRIASDTFVQDQGADSLIGFGGRSTQH
jgi:hypothetical protein